MKNTTVENIAENLRGRLLRRLKKPGCAAKAFKIDGRTAIEIMSDDCELFFEVWDSAEEMLGFGKDGEKIEGDKQSAFELLDFACRVDALELDFAADKLAEAGSLEELAVLFDLCGI